MIFSSICVRPRTLPEASVSGALLQQLLPGPRKSGFPSKAKEPKGSQTVHTHWRRMVQDFVHSREPQNNRDPVPNVGNHKKTIMATERGPFKENKRQLILQLLSHSVDVTVLASDSSLAQLGQKHLVGSATLRSLQPEANLLPDPSPASQKKMTLNLKGDEEPMTSRVDSAIPYADAYWKSRSWATSRYRHWVQT